MRKRHERQGSKLNIRESDQKIKSKTHGDKVEETMSTKSCRERDTKKARATRNKEQTKDKKIKNKTLENYMNL